MQIFQQIENCSFRTGMLSLIHYRKHFLQSPLGFSLVKHLMPGTEKDWAQEERGFGTNTAHVERG
jgi:hypothetical protein